MKDYLAISADAHLECEPTGWVERMPANLRAEAPRVVKMPDGGDGWAIGDKAPIPLGLQLTGGQRYDEFVLRGLSFGAKLPGSGDAHQRLREQDQDGTDAELLFSAVAGRTLKTIKNPEVVRAVAKAYNEWLSDYCSVAPDRLLGVAVIPPTSAEDAVAELERAAKKPGIRAAQLITFPGGGSWATVGDEPFWKAANEIGLTIVGHHNFGGEEKGKSEPITGQGTEKRLQIEGSVDLVTFAWLLTCDLPIPTIPILTIQQLFLGGVLDRYPKLRFHFAETGIGWLPYWLEQMDDRWDRHRFWAKTSLPRRPSEYVRQHFTFSFQEDHAGVALRHSIGLDNICWASDFPHSVGDWPWSRETRDRQFRGLPTEERRKIEALNILAQLRMITPEQKQAMAAAPRNEPTPISVAARGGRRM